MPRRTIRLTSATDERIESASKLGGYSTPSAFLRAAINKELAQGQEVLARAEEQIVASILERRRDVPH
jgi:Arc/MetJ-type ribon-helix-helix transcriptional regulator